MICLNPSWRRKYQDRPNTYQLFYDCPTKCWYRNAIERQYRIRRNNSSMKLVEYHLRLGFVGTTSQHLKWTTKIITTERDLIMTRMSGTSKLVEYSRLMKQFLRNFIIRIVMLATIAASFVCSVNDRLFPYGLKAICKRQEKTCSGHVSIENRWILYRWMDITLLLSFVQNLLQILLDWFSEMRLKNSDKWFNDGRSGSQNTMAWNKFNSSESLRSVGL